MFGRAVKQLRRERGLTQQELARLAGVSRQLVGTVEAGRHLPRIDAAVRLAGALDTSVEALSGPSADQVVDVTGAAAPSGTPLRVARVGGRFVCDRAGSAGEGWEIADAVLTADGLELMPGASPGAVVVGCDPALALLERIVGQQRGARAMAVAASTAEAIDALEGGRAHAGVVHGPPERLPTPTVAVDRWHLARWRVGLAAPLDAPAGWWRDALAGRRPVAQRRAGAATQAAFEAAVAASGGERARGPLAHGHMDAAWYARRQGLVAVTIEPAAIAAGLAFHPLEEHAAQLWIADAHAHEAGVSSLGEALVSRGFRERVAAIGGYDLSDLGQRAAA